MPDALPRIKAGDRPVLIEPGAAVAGVFFRCLAEACCSVACLMGPTYKLPRPATLRQPQTSDHAESLAAHCKNRDECATRV